MRLNVRPTAVRRDVQYTVDHANRTLPYVRGIAEDLVRDHARWRACVRAYEAATAAQGPARPDAAVQALQREARHLADDLRRGLADLAALGIECRSLDDGIVDFPAVVDGTPAWLCWSPGEPEVASWRRRGAGATVRRPLAGAVVADPAAPGAPAVDGPAMSGPTPITPRPARAGEAS